jgi:hypothetical protein
VSHKNNLKYHYKIVILQGNHGPWLFVRADDQVIMEQAGLTSAKQALLYALAAIESHEKDSKWMEKVI